MSETQEIQEVKEKTQEEEKETKKYSKYKVSKDKSVRTYKDIVFDSVAEMNYYIDVVEPGLASGEILKCEMQKKYELQPKFEKNGQCYRAITYIADYVLYYKDRIDVIDIKGALDQKAPIKKKLFIYKYPELNLIWLKHVKKFGGWITYEEYKKLKREERLRKAKEKMEENEDGKN